jgi:hypothetical protein
VGLLDQDASQTRRARPACGSRTAARQAQLLHRAALRPCCLPGGQQRTKAAHQAVKGLLLRVVARERAPICSEHHGTACDGDERGVRRTPEATLCSHRARGGGLHPRQASAGLASCQESCRRRAADAMQGIRGATNRSRSGAFGGNRHRRGGAHPALNTHSHTRQAQAAKPPCSTNHPHHRHAHTHPPPTTHAAHIPMPTHDRQTHRLTTRTRTDRR